MRVAHRLREHRLRERLEGRRHIALTARLEPDAEVRMHAGQALDLGQEGRARGARCPPERSLQSAAQLALGRPGSHWRSRARAKAGRSPSPSRAMETPNKTLDDPSWISRARLMRCSSCEARSAWVATIAGYRGQRRGLAEGPQQVALGVVQRRCGEQAIGEDHPDRTTSGHHGGADQPHRFSDERCELVRDLAARSPATSMTLSSRSARAAIGADSTVTWAPAN